MVLMLNLYCLTHDQQLKKKQTVVKYKLENKVLSCT